MMPIHIKMNFEETLKFVLNKSLEVIKMYEWLLDLYVLDFFVDDHWSKLPASWQKAFKSMSPQTLGEILSGNHINSVLPLSFLALRKTIEALSLPRKVLFDPAKYVSTLHSPFADKSMKHLFLRHVKLKKRHEINVMADIVKLTSSQTECNAVIDFGSGMGHLVRLLSYKYDMAVAGIEADTPLSLTARKLDLQLQTTAKKVLGSDTMAAYKNKDPLRLNITLSSLEQLEVMPFPKNMVTYGVCGLHPCGDLGPLLLRHFVKCKKVKFICVVGCCYMKLTDEGYPMSSYLATLDSKLSYVSREISCHAIEVYCDRLFKANDKELRVHAYRAAFERLLVSHDPHLKHLPVRNIKQIKHRWSFQQYCFQAVEKMKISLPPAGEKWVRGVEDVRQWRRVLAVYTMRLMLAPLVETVILLDRMLYLVENGMSCTIQPVFDPKISPRNFIIVAKKT